MTRGKATYKKPRERLTDNKKACIDWLEHNGISPVVNAVDPAAPANIDLTIDCKPWEMKNITNVSSSTGNQLRRVRRKWWKLKLGKRLRAVFTTEGANDTFDEIVPALEGKKHEV